MKMVPLKTKNELSFKMEVKKSEWVWLILVDLRGIEKKRK